MPETHGKLIFWWGQGTSVDVQQCLANRFRKNEPTKAFHQKKTTSSSRITELADINGHNLWKTKVPWSIAHFYSWITRLSRLCILGCFFPVFSGHVHSGLCILFTYCPSQNFDVPAFVCGTKFSWLNFGNMCQVTLHPGMDGMVAGVGAGVTLVTGAGSSGAGSAGAAAAIHGGPQTCGDALRWQSRGKRKLLIIRR